jgi:hypothetical protein
VFRLHTVLVTVAAGLLAASLPMQASALVAPDASSQAGPTSFRSIKGTWQVVIDPAPPGGADTFESTIAFGATMEVVETTSRSTNISAGIGAWKRVGPAQFKMTFQKYRFDATGAYLGKTIVTETIQVLSRTAYTGQATTQVVAPNGTVVAQFDSESRGSRLLP